MRVIGGDKRGFGLFSPPSMATRPMLDRVKEAVFSMIQFDLEGARVLDLFAGTGSLGIEALSRGALSAVFIEKAPEVCDVLRKNTHKTDYLDVTKVIVGDVISILTAPILHGEEYKVVFLDPPYPMQDDAKQQIIELLVGNKNSVDPLNGLLEAGAMIVLHQEKHRDVLLFSELEIIKDKLYGTSRIIVYRKKLPINTEI